MVQKEFLLQVVKKFVQPELGLDIETYNREIEEAVALFHAGKGISHEEVVKLTKLR